MIIYADKEINLVIGYTGENERSVVVFDLTPFVNDIGPGTASLRVQRNGDADPYPVILDQTENEARWTIQRTDVAQPGYAECQLSYVNGQKVGKSKKYRLHIISSLGDPKPTTPSEQAFLDKAMQVVDESKKIAQAIRDDADAGKFNGKNGTDGFSPAAEVTQTPDGAAITITDQNGTTTTTVKNGRDGKNGKNGVQIDDTAISDGKTWSSLQIIQETADRYCPLLHQKAPIVQNKFVSNYPLHVKSHIEPKQEGSGTPSPDNVRSINGWDGAKLNLSNGVITTDFTVKFGRSVYGGAYDWQSGELTEIIKKKTSADVPFYGIDVKNGYSRLMFGVEQEKIIDTRVGYCSIAPFCESSFTYDRIALTSTASGIFLFMPTSVVGTTHESAQAWIDSINKVKPIEFVYAVTTQTTSMHTPQKILSLSGTNTLYSDTGDTEVAGRADPIAVFSKIQADIVSLQNTMLKHQGDSIY